MIHRQTAVPVLTITSVLHLKLLDDNFCCMHKSRQDELALFMQFCTVVMASSLSPVGYLVNMPGLKATPSCLLICFVLSSTSTGPSFADSL